MNLCISVKKNAENHYLKQKKGGYDPETDQAIQLDFQKRYYGGGTRSVYGEEGEKS